MDYLTLCFFEHPAARVHINIWEKLMKDRIINKFELKFYEGYNVKRDNVKEVILCIPIGLIKSFDVFQENLRCIKEVQYLKSLIFGKITQEDLVLISSIIDYVSKSKVV